MTHEETEIRTLQERFWMAANAGDRRTLETLLDDSFLYVEADGLDRKDKAAFIDDVADRGDDSVLSFELTNVQVRLGSDMAIAFAQFHIEQNDDGERFRSSGNAIEMFRRYERDWKVVGSVFGEIPPFVE